MKEIMKATALKAYLQKNYIHPSSLAKRCHISENYLSNILNAQRTNPRLPILVRLAIELDLSVHTVTKLLSTSYESFISEKEHLENHFVDCLQQVLDASEQGDFSTISRLNEAICTEVHDSASLKSNYLIWYEAFNLTSQDKFELSIPLFLRASRFVPRYEIEKRFKGKVLLGLGTAYTARGNYRDAIKSFRQSLLLWSEGFQAARVYMNLGTLYRRLSRYKFSVSAYEKAYERGTASIKLYSIAGLIQLTLDKGDYNSARKWVVRGWIQAKTTDNPRGKGDLYCNIAEYYSAIGKFHISKDLFRKAIHFAIISGDLRTKHWAQVELALLFLKQGYMKEFNTLIQELESELSGVEDILLIVKHLNVLGKKYLEQGEYFNVISIAEKAYKFLISLSPSPSSELMSCCELLYKVYTALKVPSSADFYLKELNKFKN